MQKQQEIIIWASNSCSHINKANQPRHGLIPFTKGGTVTTYCYFESTLLTKPRQSFIVLSHGICFQIEFAQEAFFLSLCTHQQPSVLGVM